MRSLVILRGAPGAGKSTWIEKMGLSNYTLSADSIRMLAESPVMTENGYAISQKNDNYVWSLLFELLEKRMSKGEFIIVDATHSRSSDFSRYNKLCERYRYRRYYVDFSDVSIEECKRRNKLRAQYKQVPDKVIDKIYSRLRTQGKTSGWVKVDRDNFWQEIGTKLFNFNKYDEIHIMSDIHGCYTVLKNYLISQYKGNEEINDDNLEKAINDNDMYIFAGDYLDRGIENEQTLRFLIKLSKLSNVLFLEGNHELWLKMYANEDEENIRSRVFLNRTEKEIESIDKAEIRTFCRKLGQMAYFEFDGFKYLVTHGGLSFVPKELQLIATEQLIHGVGDYDVDIDKIFADNFDGVIQIHGHRNTFEIDDVNGKSYNLEGKCEMGGDLRVCVLSKGNYPKMLKIHNDVYKIEQDDEIIEEKKIPRDDDYVKLFQNSKLIKETKLDNNISSFNFTREAFFKKNWNDVTTKARGLFVDMSTGKVIARGYDKFFNIGERRETELSSLSNKFKNKEIVCYKKYNGFLGIMSMVNNELFLATKSTTKGDYADYFKDIFNNSDIDKDALKKYLSGNDVSLTFEVIDPVHDPHIIKYDKPQLVLLDIIDNSFEFNKRPYEEVTELSLKINCPCKEIYKKFNDFRTFHEWYLKETDEDNMSQTNLEGVVIECDGLMTKLKFPYYNFWKFMRKIKDTVSKRKVVKLSSLYNAETNYVYSWLKKQPEDELKKDIIYLRERYENEK